MESNSSPIPDIEYELQNYEEPHLVDENWLTRKPDPAAPLLTILSLAIVVLVSIFYWTDLFGLAGYLEASPEKVFKDHQYWRLWSTFLIHADQRHLFGNLFLFAIFGFFLSGYFSLWVFPVMAFLMGGLTNFIVLSKMGTNSTLLGLSGVVFWMGAAWLTLYFLIEHRKKIFQRIIRTLGVSLVLFMPSEALDPHVSYLSHGWGFLLGIIFATLFYIYNRQVFKGAEISCPVF
jgi:rhomboid protease GluP